MMNITHVSARWLVGVIGACAAMALLWTTFSVRAVAAPTADPCATTTTDCGTDAARVATVPPPADVVPPELEAFARTFALKSDPEVQPVGVLGTNLGPGLTARLTSPRGIYISTYSGASFSDVTANSFRLNAHFSEPGTYLLSVRDGRGMRSNEISVVVK